MKVLRTPDSQFENLNGYPYEPVYTNITAKDGTELRVHHIDEGPRRRPNSLSNAWTACMELFVLKNDPHFK